MALLPPGGSRRRWAPSTVQTNCVLRGSLPGLARGRRRLPHSPPRAEAALQSWPLGSALPPSPRRRLRLRRARHRLTLPPQLWLGTGRSGSPDAEPGKRRAAGSASGGAAEALGRARRPLLFAQGRSASAGHPRRRRASGSGAARRALRASCLELRPGRGGGQNRRSPSSGRQEASCPGACNSPGRPAQKTSPSPRCRRGHGRAGLRAGPRDPQSLLAAWARSRGRARAQRPWEGPRVPRLGARAVEPIGVARPHQMPPAKLERRKLQLQGDSDRDANRAPRNPRP